VHRVPRGRLLTRRGGAGLVSAAIPVIVGIMLAFGWNAAGSYWSGTYTTGARLAPGVKATVEQAAAQAWAHMAPPAAPIRAWHGVAPAP
jgi:hypothetical protein